MSSTNHHRDFMIQTILYIARLIANQEYEEVEELGIRRDQAEAIRGMTMEKLQKLSLNIRASFFTFHAEPALIDAALLMLKRQEQEEDMDLALVEAGARYEMMRDLGGMTTEQYAKLRRYLGLKDGRGRPHDPTDAEKEEVFISWKLSAEEEDLKRRYLKVHEETGIPVGSIWKLVQEWDSIGEESLGKRSVLQPMDRVSVSSKAVVAQR